MGTRDTIEKRTDGRYRPNRRVAVSRSTAIWEALDTASGRRVAFKRLRKRASVDRAMRTRFAREIEIHSRMNHHHHVLAVTDAELAVDRPFLVTEFVPGDSLESVLRRGQLPQATAVKIAAALGRAIAHVHDRGALHCDIKPANVLVRNDGQIKLADFGIARDRYRPHLDTGVFGSIHYMAPERLLGDPPSAASDIYGLGVTLYEMLTGQRPFEGATPMEIAVAHRRGSVPAALHLVPTVYSDIVASALASHPEARFASADGMAVALENADRAAQLRTIAS